MNFTYETLGSSNFLIYELQERDQLDTMALGMLTNNSIPGLAEAVYHQMDNNKYIKYNITSKLTAATVFSSPMSKKRLLNILSSMVAGLLNAEEYMLDPGSILLDSSYIFVDGPTGEVSLVCLPILMEGKQPDLRAFFKEMVFEWTKFEQSDDFSFMASLLNYFNSVPVLSLLDFKALLDKLANEKSSSSAPRHERERDRTYNADQGKTEIDKSSASSRRNDEGVKGGKVNKVRSPWEGPDTPPGRNDKKPDLKFGIGGPHYDKNEEPKGAEPEAEGMSMWYLLQHFSKENLEIYKSQKDGAKEAKPEPKAEKKSRKKDREEPEGRGFSIPGDPPPKFDVPGQKDEVNLPTPEPEPKHKPERKPERKPEKEPKIERKPIHFGGDPDAGSDLTVVDESSGPCLVRVSTGEIIELNKTPFRIGRERRSVDYAITGNPTISKKHIEVRFEKGEFQVCDEDSLNHTYINGKRIPKKTWKRITTGDILRLNNEEFECKLN